MISELMWRVTYRCNKKCQYCFNEVFSDKVNHLCIEKLDIEYLEKFVHKFGIKKVYISGGEPAVVDDLERIIERVSRFSGVILFTNGLLFEKYDVDAISIMHLHAINTTIDLQDIVNNTGHFNMLMELFSLLKSKAPDMKVNVQIMIDDNYFDVINSEGYSKMETIVDRVLWQPLTVPRDSSLFAETLEGMPSQKVDMIISDLKRRSQGEMFEHISNLSEVVNNLGAKECLMGIKYITMNPDMSICVCPHRNDYLITENDLEKMINDNKALLCDKFSMRCFSLYSHLKRRFGDGE